MYKQMEVVHGTWRTWEEAKEVLENKKKKKEGESCRKWANLFRVTVLKGLKWLREAIKSLEGDGGA